MKITRTSQVCFSNPLPVCFTEILHFQKNASFVFLQIKLAKLSSESGLDFIQFINRKFPDYDRAIQQWHADCPLPNGKHLYSRIKLKLINLMKKNVKDKRKIDFSEAINIMWKDTEFDENFNGLGKVVNYINFDLKKSFTKYWTKITFFKSQNCDQISCKTCMP